LTDAGRLFLSAARIIFKELLVLENEIQLMRAGEIGSLAIGVQAVATQDIMAKAVRQYKERHPRSTLRLVDGVLANLLGDLREGKFDLVFGRMTPGMLGLDLEGLPLANEPYVAVASCHLPGGNEIADWETALTLPWCLPPAGTPVTDIFTAFLRDRGLAVPECLAEARSPLFIFSLMKEMRLCALIPESMVGPWQDQIGIQRTVLPLDLKMHPLGLIWSKKLSQTPAASTFRKIVADLHQAAPA
jgi:DNA-binding transcriptional LysR family regulator